MIAQYLGDPELRFKKQEELKLKKNAECQYNFFKYGILSAPYSDRNRYAIIDNKIYLAEQNPCSFTFVAPINKWFQKSDQSDYVFYKIESKALISYQQHETEITRNYISREIIDADRICADRHCKTRYSFQKKALISCHGFPCMTFSSEGAKPCLPASECFVHWRDLHPKGTDVETNFL